MKTFVHIADSKTNQKVVEENGNRKNKNNEHDNSRNEVHFCIDIAIIVFAGKNILIV